MSGYGQQSQGYPMNQGWKPPGGYRPQSFGAFDSTYSGNQGTLKPLEIGGNQQSMPPWMKSWTPPGGWTPPGTTPQQPPPTQPPAAPPPANRPGDFGPLPPTNPPTGQPNPAQFPGVPQHLLSAITTDPSGRMLYGPDKQPVKFQGGKMVFDSTPFVPGQGQFGQFGAPGAGGFTLDQSSGRNMILGGANGPQMYNAEGLVQGGQAPQNFVNYLNSYRR